MAKKRMFSTSIVEDDVFLDMPLSSQSLYFHLCMNADDEGFVSPKRIMRMISATHDDLKILIAKRYILVFESGVVVIKHWHNNNSLRKDRLTPTTYQQELQSLTFNEWGVYTEKRSSQTSLISALTPDYDDDRLTTVISDEDSIKQPNDNQMTTQYSIGKVSIGKINTNSAPAEAAAKTKKTLEKVSTEDITEMLEKWEEVVGMNIDNIANRKACAALVREIGKDKVTQLIKGAALAIEDKYAPRISDFVSLKRKKNDLILWGRKQNNSSNVEVIS